MAYYSSVTILRGAALDSSHYFSYTGSMSASVLLVSPSDPSVVMTGPTPCRRCGRTTTWARTRKGARILMDFHPAPYGEWCIVGIDHPFRIMAKLQSIPVGAKRYMCHFDTCANPNPYYRKRLAHKRANAAFKREWDKRALAKPAA